MHQQHLWIPLRGLATRDDKAHPLSTPVRDHMLMREGQHLACAQQRVETKGNQQSKLRLLLAVG